MLRLASASSPAKKKRKRKRKKIRKCCVVCRVVCAACVVRTENALGVEVGRDEAALAFEGLLGGEAAHVGHLHDVLQILIYIPF
jgi:hypothetical protein